MITECKQCGFESVKLIPETLCPNCQFDIMREVKFQENVSNEAYFSNKCENLKLEMA